jgi:hypothetical protein
VAFGVIVVARPRGVTLGVIVVADHAALVVAARAQAVALGVIVAADHAALGVFVGTLPVIGHRRPPLLLLVFGMTTAINVPDQDLGRLSTG